MNQDLTNKLSLYVERIDKELKALSFEVNSMNNYAQDYENENEKIKNNYNSLVIKLKDEQYQMKEELKRSDRIINSIDMLSNINPKEANDLIEKNESLFQENEGLKKKISECKEYLERCLDFIELKHHPKDEYHYPKNEFYYLTDRLHWELQRFLKNLLTK